MKQSQQLVIEKLRVYWPNEVDEILGRLDDIAMQGISPRELARIQLAILKLSSGNKEELEKNIALAKRDYRDVIAYAEYPRQMASSHLSHFNLSEEEQKESKAIIKSDREQYMAWLNDSQVV